MSHIIFMFITIFFLLFLLHMGTLMGSVFLMHIEMMTSKTATLYVKKIPFECQVAFNVRQR